MFSLCACCRRNNQKTYRGHGGKHACSREDGDVYGIVNPTVHVASEVVDGGSVQFRNGFAKKANERHSLPANNGSTGAGHSRISAPGRALPQLPADLYSAIDKGRKTSSLRFVDDSANPTYESIDPDADSFIDPLYSKVGDPVSTRRDRKYDYPVFPGRRNEPGPSRQPDETYQSASQIYGGSEDPYRHRIPVVRFKRSNIYHIPLTPPRVSVAQYYRSIPSSSRVAGAEYGDEDSSSAYDPGYAKVQNMNQQRLERIEKKEREVDQLYTKISRVPRDPDEEPGPRPVVDLSQEQQELPVLSMFNPGAPAEVVAADSREPSYRYITVRENAERVRERLRQQGQLDLPTREQHYYSSIGNEYDTIQGGSSTYGPPAQPSLTVHTESNLAPYAPPPPTSPIPHRIDYTDSHLVNERSTLPAYATVNKKRNSTGGSVGSSHGPGWNPLSLSTATSFAGLTRSFNGTPFGQISPVGASSISIQGIKEFMQKPLLPYPSKETLLGRKVVEEREQIIEKRMSQSMGPSIDLGSSPQDRVYRVEINRVADGPSVDTIISGRRYRGSTTHLNEGVDPPGSGRSNLPLPTNRAETSRLSELAHQRKQRSLESDAVDYSRTAEKEKRRNRKDSSSSRSSLLNSTIYTGKDYVSTMDMGHDRPWPMSRDSSPSSRNEKP